jgi:hypothetical protein
VTKKRYAPSIRDNEHGGEREVYMKKKRAVIVDIDGTLLDDTSVKYRYFLPDPDWDNVDSSTLPVNEWCKTLVESIHDKGVHIIFLTGRKNTIEAMTRIWLDTNLSGIVDDYDLIMRPKEETRSDTEYKMDVFIRDILPVYDILFAIDDKRSVIDMWRNLGIPALHCADFNL